MFFLTGALCSDRYVNVTDNIMLLPYQSNIYAMYPSSALNIRDTMMTLLILEILP